MFTCLSSFITARCNGPGIIVPISIDTKNVRIVGLITTRAYTKGLSSGESGVILIHAHIFMGR